MGFRGFLSAFLDYSERPQKALPSVYDENSLPNLNYIWKN